MNASVSKTRARKWVALTRLRKSVTGFHLLIHLLLLAMLWAMINYLGLRHYLREDWSRQQWTELSARTKTILSQIEEPVQLTLLMGDDFMGADPLTDLLAEYRRALPGLRVRKVDPDRDIGDTEELRARYGVTEPNTMILSFQGRTRILPLAGMLVMESDETRPLGEDPRMVGFRGEQVITSGLLTLTRTDRPVIYFLSGHGEKEIDNFERVPQGYSAIRERLEADNLEVRTLNLEETQRIPRDASLVVIAGPRTRISQPELDLLRSYMLDVGRLMVLVDAQQDAGLGPFLREFGVQLSDDWVVDPTRTLRGPDLHVSQYGDHSITAPMTGIRSIFIRPRSITAAAAPSDAADRPQFTPLAKSTDQGWAQTDFNQDPVEFNQGVDRRGPIPVAAAVEWQRGGGSDEAETRRLVVFGDSLFPGNYLSNGGGMILFQQAAHWLLMQEDLLEIPARELTEIRLQVDRRELNQLLLWAGLALPGAVLLLGGIIAMRRRG